MHAPGTRSVGSDGSWPGRQPPASHCSVLLPPAYPFPPPAVAPTPAESVVAFARAAAETSVTNAEALVAAIKEGSLDAAKAAYLKLRPEYEQIEHLYELFPDSDRCVSGAKLVPPWQRAQHRSGRGRLLSSSRALRWPAGQHPALSRPAPLPPPPCLACRSDIDSRPDAHEYGEAYIKGLEGIPGAVFKVSKQLPARAPEGQPGWRLRAGTRAGAGA